MIGWIEGHLKCRDGDGRLMVQLGGLGYWLSVPLSVGADCEIGDLVSFWTHTHVREDEISLFGFENETQLKVFQLLTTVSGIGPKVGLGILGQLSPEILAEAIQDEDIGRLTQAKGVGKRTAERMVLELRGKLDFVTLPSFGAPRAGKESEALRPALQMREDLKSALSHLGFRPKEVALALDELAEEDFQKDLEFSSLLKKALQLLRSPLRKPHG